jgi:hypothetical protein
MCNSYTHEYTGKNYGTEFCLAIFISLNLLDCYDWFWVFVEIPIPSSLL